MYWSYKVAFILIYNVTVETIFETAWPTYQTVYTSYTKCRVQLIFSLRMKSKNCCNLYTYTKRIFALILPFRIS